jgi:hypothetical protein
MRQAACEKSEYWLPAFNPGGYQTQFDGWANALALLLDLGNAVQQQQTRGYILQLCAQLPAKLLPAFWPPIQAGNGEWEALQNNHKYAFRNHPFEFHNGGSWAVINGFLGMALAKGGLQDEASNLLHHIHKANCLSEEGDAWGFYENLHTQTQAPIGTKYCAWSAAGAIMLQAYLQGKRLLGT